MRTIYILFCASVLINTGFSQSIVYHPLPNTNAGWKCRSGGFEVDDCKSYQFLITGDTNILGLTYHKIQKSGVKYWMTTQGWCTVNVQEYFDYYVGAYRNDSINRKVYFVQPGTTVDTLLYNFNYSLQSPLSPSVIYNPGWGIFIISSIDSVLVGSQYRRRFGISTSNGDEFTYLIEGIGSTKGLLEPIRHEIEHFTSLVCFKQDNNTLYPDTAYNCLIYTAIENNTQNNGFQIRPNPVNDEAELITTSDAIKATLVLFNYLGEQVLICNNVINGSKINFTSLPSGMYFYYILNFDGKIFKGKLLIK